MASNFSANLGQSMATSLRPITTRTMLLRIHQVNRTKEKLV